MKRPIQTANSAEWPEVPQDLLAYLEAAYQPRCWDPRKETEWQHHQYTGMVELVQRMRAAFDRQRDAMRDRTSEYQKEF